jgi:hypothetical protein
MSTDGNVEYAKSGTFQEKEPVVLSELEFRMLQLSANFYLEHLPKDENGVMRVTTLQSRMGRSLTGAVRTGSKAETYVMADEKAKRVSSEMNIMLAETGKNFKVEDKKLLEVTPKGYGGVHFANTKDLVSHTLEHFGFNPDDFLSHVVPHDTEMREIGDKLEPFTETETVDGEDVTTEYKADGRKYDGVQLLEYTTGGKNKKDGVTFQAHWCRQLHIIMEVPVKDADGKVTMRKVCVLEKPEDQFGGDFFGQMDGMYYPAKWYFSSEYMHPMTTGANFHNLANQVIMFACGPEALEDLKQDIEDIDTSKKIGKRGKTGKDRLKKVAPVKKFMTANVKRARYELLLTALLNFKMRLNHSMLKAMFQLAMNESYSQNPIGQDLLLKEMSFDHRRELPNGFKIKKVFRDFQVRLPNASDDEVRAFIEYLGSVDVTKIPCRADGDVSDTGNGQGLIFSLKKAVSDLMWHRDDDEDEEEKYSNLTAKERHIVKTSDGRREHVREVQKPIQDFVMPLKPKSAAKK